MLGRSKKSEAIKEPKEPRSKKKSPKTSLNCWMVTGSGLGIFCLGAVFGRNVQRYPIDAKLFLGGVKGLVFLLLILCFLVACIKFMHVRVKASAGNKTPHVAYAAAVIFVFLIIGITLKAVDGHTSTGQKGAMHMAALAVVLAVILLLLVLRHITRATRVDAARKAAMMISAHARNSAARRSPPAPAKQPADEEPKVRESVPS